MLCPTSTHLSTAKWLKRRGAELPHPSLKALQVPASTFKIPCTWEEIPSCPQQHFQARCRPPDRSDGPDRFAAAGEGGAGPWQPPCQQHGCQEGESCQAEREIPATAAPVHRPRRGCWGAETARVCWAGGGGVAWAASREHPRVLMFWGSTSPWLVPGAPSPGLCRKHGEMPPGEQGTASGGRNWRYLGQRGGSSGQGVIL